MYCLGLKVTKSPNILWTLGVQLKGEDATTKCPLCGSRLLLLRPRLRPDHHHLCPLLTDNQHIPH